MQEQEKEKKKKKGGKGSLIILIIAAAVVAVALFKLVPILIDYHESAKGWEEIADGYEQVDPNIDQDIDTGEGDWWYQDVKIQFDELKAINNDVVAWLRFDDQEELPIDYPVLYSGDDTTYLHADINKEYHYAGSVFLEGDNSPDMMDYHSIIYGHNMRDGSMFGTLKKYNRDESFYDNHQYFTIYTEEGVYRYQIFAYSVVDRYNDIYQVGFKPDQEYTDFIQMIIKQSLKDTGIVPTNKNRIVTLSTCSGSSGTTNRLVVTGVMVDHYLFED